ncbi:glycosyltransferase [Actinopolymorpha sp. B11F2]
MRSIGQARVAVAHPGVDTTAFSPSPIGWHRDGYLLSVCRLGDPRKGLERMILAYGDLVRFRSSAPRLVLAGRGDLPRSVQRLIVEQGLNHRVLVRPNVSTEQLVDLYRGASVFLQTSYEEGLGLSVLEAMACGLPVVATATHGAEECIDQGLTGWLVQHASPEALRRLLVARVLDVLDQTGQEMGARGRERCVALFSTDVALHRFTDTYRAMLVGRSPRRATERASHGIDAP